MMCFSSSCTTIGVIIPVYNGEKWLNKTIESVLSQPCNDLILVVVNDGSTDKTEEVVLNECMKYDNLFYIKETNQGVSVARNMGIQFMLKKGVRFLAFLDADDIWVPGFFTSDLKDLLCCDNKDVYQFSHYWGNENLTRLKQHIAGNFDEKSSELNRFNRTFCSYIYNSRLFQNYGISFPKGIKQGEDVVFKHLILTIAKTYRSLDRYIFVYRSNSSSFLHQRRTKNTENHFLYSIIPSWNWAKKEFARIRKIDANLLDDVELYQCDVMKKTYAVDAIINLCELGFSLQDIRKIINDFSLNNMIDNNLYLDNKRQVIMSMFKKHPYIIRLFFRFKAIGIRVISLFRNNPIVQLKRYPLKAKRILG